MNMCRLLSGMALAVFEAAAEEQVSRCCTAKLTLNPFRRRGRDVHRIHSEIPFCLFGPWQSMQVAFE